MQLTSIDLFLWVAGLAGHCILLAVLLLRKRAAEFPVFTSLIGFYIARSLLLMAVHHAGTAPYFYTYWSFAIVDVVLQLAVLWEVTRDVFQPGKAMLHKVRSALLLICGVSVIAAGVLTWLASPATNSLASAFVLRGDFFSAVLMSELFTGMLVLSAVAGLPWKTHSARIGQGLGTNAFAGILAAGMQNFYGLAEGTKKYTFLSQAQFWVYLACLIFWIVALFREAPAPRELPAQLVQQLYLLQVRVASTLELLRSRTSA